MEKGLELNWPRVARIPGGGLWGASVHDAKSGINGLSLRGLPDASPEMGGVSGVGGVVACSLVRFHLSV